MFSPKEYGDHVVDCMQRAEQALSDTERNAFLEMARAWLEAAVRADLPVEGRLADKPDSRGVAADGDETIINWNVVLEVASQSAGLAARL